MSWTFEATQHGYLAMWRRATIKPGADAAGADKFAKIIIANEARYRKVEASIGVPWFFIGALHMRESGCDFAGVLHNGDKIIGTGGLTTHVPEGRGPFATWEESAIDALRLKNLHRVQEWPVERMLFSAEVFNGLGYVGKGVNSSYVWAGTSLEQPGKYIADHVWDASADDKQIGIACVLKRLCELRPDIDAALHDDTVDTSVPVVVPRVPEVLPPQNAASELLRQLLPILAPVAWSLVRDKVPADQRAPIEQLMQTLFGTPPGTPAPVVPPVVPVVPNPVPVTPSTPAAPTSAARPSVWLSILAAFGSAVAMDQGTLGTPLGMGENPTLAGTIGLLAPLATAAIGATGGFAPLARIGISVLASFAQGLASRVPKQ